MVYVGWKSTNVNFTVHQVEQLNWKKRGRAGIYKIPKRNWSVGIGALPPKTSQVHILYSSCLVWFIADFLFWWGHDDFSHEFKDPRPPQKRVLFGHFPPSTVVTALFAGKRPENILSLDLVGWKGSVCGDLYTSLFTTKSQLSEGKSWFSSSPQLCVSCRDSLRLRMPYLVRVPKYSTDTCSSGPAMTFMCGFRDARRYWLQWTKFQISKREY